MEIGLARERTDTPYGAGQVRGTHTLLGTGGRDPLKKFRAAWESLGIFPRWDLGEAIHSGQLSSTRVSPRFFSNFTFFSMGRNPGVEQKVDKAEIAWRTGRFGLIGGTFGTFGVVFCRSLYTEYGVWSIQVMLPSSLRDYCTCAVCIG